METMKKVESIEQYLILFEEYSINKGEAMNTGGSKSANRYYNNIENIVGYLRESKRLSQLSVFYNHPNAFVRLSAAAYLLSVFEKESLKVMKKISKENGIVSLNAKMTIREWENGNLRNFYTL